MAIKYISLSKLSAFLDNLKNTFAPLSHKHSISDVTDYTVDSALSPTSTNPVQNKVIDEEFEAVANAMNALDLAIDGKADSDHTHDDRYYTETEVNTKLSELASQLIEVDDTLTQSGQAADAKVTGDAINSNVAKIGEISDTVVDLSSTVSTNYNESIIGLSIDGQVITYIKGDGSVHTIITQDTNTTYSLGTDEVTGLTKLYATVGNAEDGTMTQRAIKTELDKKVGVTIDDSQNTLIFTI